VLEVFLFSFLNNTT